MEEILISKQELAKWLKQKKSVTIVDIRTKKDFEEWSIKDSIHVDIYEKLKANVDDPFDDVPLPANEVLITVCNGGKLSITAAEKLRARGLEAFSLQNGLNEWRIK
jgi:rhodanese-related sulfurtransferase